MAVFMSPEETAEMAKSNKPYRYEEYPRTLYKAQTRPDGKVSIGETLDSLFLRNGQEITGSAESFTRTCQLTVRSDDERQRAIEGGWRLTQAEALEFREARDRAVADVAAHRHYEDRNMSEPARAEASEADAESFGHLPAIPEKRKMGRPRKVQAEA